MKRVRLRRKRKGRGKAKGSAFERAICKLLSLWVSHGKHKDLFWRSAMSGGRATVARKKGESNRQAGDICAVTAEGHTLTDEWYIECKAYRNVKFLSWMLHNNGLLAVWWRQARANAKQHDRKPMLIVKQNNTPILVITKHDAIEHWTARQFCVDSRGCDVSLFSDMLLRTF